MKMLMKTPDAAAFIGITTTLTAASLVVVALRFYNRLRVKQAIFIDDWLMVPCIVMIIGLLAIVGHGVATQALGYPSPLMQLQTQGLKPRGSDRSAIAQIVDLLSLTAKLEYSFICIVVPLLGLIKISVLAFYRRLFVIEKSNARDARNLIVTISMVFVALWAITFDLAFIWMCKGDFNAAFGPPAEVAEKCIDAPLLAYIFSISDFITDALIILIPIPFVWKLQLSVQKKLAVTSIFLLGIFASIASLIRLIWSVWSREVGFDPSLDGELITTSLLFWFVVEANVGIIAACLPAVRGLFTNERFGIFFSGIRSKWSSYTDSKSPNSKEYEQFDSETDSHSYALKEIWIRDSAV
ncbi:unnamed protein product [Periconia digitata]|uniref:Rhodopsin domain-containing protein n=1 Tax=Periconia digitata TaxID=1303443 RepID=A0A9W4U8D2_9PLEO|nr:unnamed protein product [Periconia digitata]